MLNDEDLNRTTFVQLHALAAYPPACLNRDDLGRPKTAQLGGVERLRVSSQCLKRAWRTSRVFEEHVGDLNGVRTRNLRPTILSELRDRGMTAKAKSKKASKDISKAFGDLDDDDEELSKHDRMVHLTAGELDRIDDLLDTLVEDNRRPEDEEVESLFEPSKGVDTGMFGRMMADDKDQNIEAAVQVSHAVTTHAATVEDDFFTAVDDANDGFTAGSFFEEAGDVGEDEGAGSGHMGVRRFGEPLLYLYVNVDLNLLADNLQGDLEATERALEALIRSVMTVSPSGMQNSYGSQTVASYGLLEIGARQPFSLLNEAYNAPVSEGDWIERSIEKLRESWRRVGHVYGTDALDDVRELDVRSADVDDGPIGSDDLGRDGQLDDFASIDVSSILGESR